MVSMWLLGLASLPALAQVSRETLAKKTAIDGPGSLALDKKGHLFVAEIDGNVVRRMNLRTDRKSTRLNSSHGYISYAVFCLKKKKTYDIYLNPYIALPT